MPSTDKSLTVDVLNVRTIFARGANNSTLPAYSVLVTDGQGGTQWVSAYALQNNLAFTTISTSVGTFTANALYPAFGINDGPNVTLLGDPTASNTISMFAKAFGKFNFQDGTSINAYDDYNQVITSNVTFTGLEGIVITGNYNSTNNIFIQDTVNASTISTFITRIGSLNDSILYDTIHFSSPISSFIYQALSSFSTAIAIADPTGPTISSLIYNLSTITATITSSSDQFVSPFSTFLFQQLSSFSTSVAYGNTFSAPSVSSMIWNISTLTGSITQSANSFVSPFSSFIYTQLSSFSTAIAAADPTGPTINSFILGLSSLNTTVVTKSSNFNSPMSTFLYQQLSSFSTSVAYGNTFSAPTFSSLIINISTLNGSIITSSKKFTSPISTFLFQQLSSFSTSVAYGNTFSAPTFSSLIINISTLNGSIITSSKNFTSPLSSFLYTQLSSFSTSLGSVNKTNKINVNSLYTSTFFINTIKQPLIQFGINNTYNGQGSLITLPTVYKDTSYVVQLTYRQVGAFNTLTPLSASNVTTSNFSVTGDFLQTFQWTTIGTNY